MSSKIQIFDSNKSMDKTILIKCNNILISIVEKKYHVMIGIIRIIMSWNCKLNYIIIVNDVQII